MKFQKKEYLTIRGRFECLIRDLAIEYKIPEFTFREEFKKSLIKKGIIKKSTTELPDLKLDRINNHLNNIFISLSKLSCNSTNASTSSAEKPIP